MGQDAPPTDEQVAKPEYVLIPAGGYMTLLHQPQGGRAHPPSIVPKPLDPFWDEMLPRLVQAEWPHGVPEFEDEIERFHQVAKWLTLRGSVALTHIANGATPARPMHEHLLVTPFGFIAEDFEHSDEDRAEAQARGVTLLEQPDLSLLENAIPDMSRMLLTALAGRVRAVLSPEAAPVGPYRLAWALARTAVFKLREQGPERAEKERELAIGTASALACAWHTQPQLRVPLACAYAVHQLLFSWQLQGQRNAAIANTDPMPTSGLMNTDGPNPVDPIPKWALGLLRSNEDIEVWRV